MVRVPPSMLVVAAVLSVQFGGAFAVTLIPLVGVVGSVLLRLTLATAVMFAVLRPRLTARTASDWCVVTQFGLCLGGMNLCFYGALAHLPIGVAVTVEFVGPLTLAAVLSRRALQLVAVGVAAVGVVLVSGVLQTSSAQVDLTGLGLGLAAGALWAAYIVLSGRTGARFDRLDGVAIAMAVAAVAVLPAGLLTGGAELWRPEALVKGLAVALMSSAVPYSLELFALRRMSAHVFGVLLSLEPAIAALAGWLVLGQLLAWWQTLGMGLVVVASLLVTVAGGDRTAAATAPRRRTGGRLRRRAGSPPVGTAGRAETSSDWRPW